MTSTPTTSNSQQGSSLTTDPKVVLITGASSGIGHATALRLANQGHYVVLGARRTDRLAALAETIRGAGGRADFHRLDVTDPKNVTTFVDTAVDLHGRIDVIINNAGIGPLSRLDSLRIDDWNQTIDVNIRGLLHGIAAALPHFQRQGSGHFVTIASVGAHEVMPTGVVYCATKYAEWAITEGLRLEIDPSIRVTTISPGIVESEIADSIAEADIQEAIRVFRKTPIPADAIAAAISYAISQPPDVDVNELVIRPTRQR